MTTTSTEHVLEVDPVTGTVAELAISRLRTVAREAWWVGVVGVVGYAIAWVAGPHVGPLVLYGRSPLGVLTDVGMGLVFTLALIAWTLFAFVLVLTGHIALAVAIGASVVALVQTARRAGWPKVRRVLLVAVVCATFSAATTIAPVLSGLLVAHNAS